MASVMSLGFPNDACTISDRLVQELTKHFRVEVTVVEKPGAELAGEKASVAKP